MGKHPHIVSCLMQLEKERGVKLELNQCLLIDDDIKNIHVCEANGVPAVHVKARHLTAEEKEEHAEGEGWEENEVVEAEKAKRDAAAADLTATLEKANLSVIQTIFDDFFKEDNEHHKLQHLPTINEHVDTLRNSIDQLSEGLKITGLQLQESKDLEVSDSEDEAQRGAKR